MSRLVIENSVRLRRYLDFRKGLAFSDPSTNIQRSGKETTYLIKFVAPLLVNQVPVTALSYRDEPAH